MSELITRRTFLKTPVLLHWSLPPAVCWLAAEMERMLPLPKIWLLLPSIIAISLILALLPQISAP